MQSHNNIIDSLRQRPSFPDLVPVLRILRPFLNEDGRAFLSRLESEVSRSFPELSPTTSTWSGSTRVASFLGPSTSPAISDTSSATGSYHSKVDPSLGSPSRARRKPAANRKQSINPYSTRGSKQVSILSPATCTKHPILPCPFCAEAGIANPFTRKYDLKRHFTTYHGNEKLWRCPEPDCGITSDFKAAFEIHTKTEHPQGQYSAKDSTLELLPQLVFACGFSDCKTVFEATGPDDAKKTAKKFFEHVASAVVKYATDGPPAPDSDWNYSVRFRNLMRQDAVDRSWKERPKGHRLVWQPHTSYVLRKILETRHFSDILLLVQWAMNLGLSSSDPSSPILNLPPNLSLPIKGQVISMVLSYPRSGHGSDAHSHIPTESLDNPAAASMDDGDDSIHGLPGPHDNYLSSQTTQDTTSQTFNIDLALTSPHSPVYPGQIMYNSNTTHDFYGSGIPMGMSLQQHHPYPGSALTYSQGNYHTGLLSTMDTPYTRTDHQADAPATYPPITVSGPDDDYITDIEMDDEDFP